MGVGTGGSQVGKGMAGNVLAFPQSQDFVGVWEARREGNLPKWKRRS